MADLSIDYSWHLWLQLFRVDIKLALANFSPLFFVHTFTAPRKYRLLVAPLTRGYVSMNY